MAEECSNLSAAIEKSSTSVSELCFRMRKLSSASEVCDRSSRERFLNSTLNSFWTKLNPISWTQESHGIKSKLLSERKAPTSDDAMKSPESVSLSNLLCRFIFDQRVRLTGRHARSAHAHPPRHQFLSEQKILRHRNDGLRASRHKR